MYCSRKKNEVTFVSFVHFLGCNVKGFVCLLSEFTSFATFVAKGFACSHISLSFVRCNVFFQTVLNQKHHNIIITHFFFTEKGKKSVAYLLAMVQHVCDEENSLFFFCFNFGHWFLWCNLKNVPEKKKQCFEGNIFIGVFFLSKDFIIGPLFRILTLIL